MHGGGADETDQRCAVAAALDSDGIDNHSHSRSQ
jgi:hypothetical protein